MGGTALGSMQHCVDMKVCLERDVLCLCIAAAVGRVIGSGTLQLECDGLGAVQTWLAVPELLFLHVRQGEPVASQQSL